MFYRRSILGPRLVASWPDVKCTLDEPGCGPAKGYEDFGDIKSILEHTIVLHRIIKIATCNRIARAFRKAPVPPTTASSLSASENCFWPITVTVLPLNSPEVKKKLRFMEDAETFRSMDVVVPWALPTSSDPKSGPTVTLSSNTFIRPKKAVGDAAVTEAVATVNKVAFGPARRKLKMANGVVAQFAARSCGDLENAEGSHCNSPAPLSIGGVEMSKTLVQPVGQKRLTNVAVVHVKRREKDLDEVLQSHTVYSNVSKGVLAKSKDLVQAFGTDDQTKVCLEILEKGELQVAGKERESQLSNQFRDIATIVMQKTYNPETKRPYTISMIERLMHDIHFAVEPNSSSKKQALEVIRELQKLYPIKRSPMRLRLTVPEKNMPSLLEKINGWNATIVSRDESGSQLSVICELEPGFFRDCDALVRSLQGRLDILAVNVHLDSDTHVDHYDDLEEESSSVQVVSKAPVVQLTEKLQKQTISSNEGSSQGEVKQQKCNTCNAFVGDAKEYREHFKSEWHKHNMRRKTRQLPPLSAEECMGDMEIIDSKADLKDYLF
ncbi:hypothetical protein SASPL_150042 [Salvia splendens]|uniref:Ribosome maturation protein SDO1 n=1 Tax=Salvia splendens TaxID=180675 RepID=A0A8X8W5V8_SALSN|nr:hypothetical protein SASPL_150042 [Salvia splendens]